MLSKLTTFLDEKLSTPMAKLAEQRHLRAIRDGIIATLPLIIVSSMFMVIAFLPNSMNKDWGITQFLLANQAKILLPYRVSMYIMTLYAVLESVIPWQALMNWIPFSAVFFRNWRFF